MSTRLRPQRFVPLCTARSARADCRVSTTAEMFRSEEPCEIASTLMLARPSAPKKRPDTPDAEFILSPTVGTGKKEKQYECDRRE